MQNNLKILLYSYLFYPSVGGIESESRSLAEGLIAQGHDCRVITESPSDKPDDFEYSIYRNPDFKTKRTLVKWADIIVYNGAGLGLQPLPVLYRKPFIWIHQGYQISCIDGLGWVEGEAAPMTPWASIAYHYKKRGLAHAFKGALKVFTKLFFAKYFVTRNVACTDWVLNRLPDLDKKVRIYSPYPIDKFEEPSPGIEIKYDFVFVGRLVSEKGVFTLISAFNKLVKEFEPGLSLLIIGDGNWKSKIEQMIAENDLGKNIIMAGRRTGQELTDLIHACRIAIAPSEWEEPMGGVALELLSAGRNIIVSSNGGMAECVGKGGLTFYNGDADALASTMKILWSDKALQARQKEEAKRQLEGFQLGKRINEHVKLFEELIKK
jgi:glycosyltransferase involved in cell wall biosynthesis